MGASIFPRQALPAPSRIVLARTWAFTDVELTMFTTTPMRKLDAPLRACVVAGERPSKLVEITVECRDGAEEEVAEAIREAGGAVLDVIPTFHIVAAEIRVGALLKLARSKKVLEVNLARNYMPA